MMDQVRKYSAQGLATQFVGEAQEDWSVTARVLDGENQLLYLSPEALLRASYGRRCGVLPSISNFVRSAITSNSNAMNNSVRLALNIIKIPSWHRFL